MWTKGPNEKKIFADSPELVCMKMRNEWNPRMYGHMLGTHGDIIYRRKSIMSQLHCNIVESEKIIQIPDICVMKFLTHTGNRKQPWILSQIVLRSGARWSLVGWPDWTNVPITNPLLDPRRFHLGLFQAAIFSGVLLRGRVTQTGNRQYTPAKISRLLLTQKIHVCPIWDKRHWRKTPEGVGKKKHWNHRVLCWYVPEQLNNVWFGFSLYTRYLTTEMR